MASTNQTTNYGLPIYSAGDRASWTDTNQPFEAIDTAVKKAVDDSADAISGVATVTETANTALGTATTAAADASSALTGLDGKQDKTDNNLNTTAKTVVGAINEVANEVSGKQNTNDNNLTTTDKTIVGAINEVASEVGDKQNATDNNLTTTAKTIVGAINEIDAKISEEETESVNFVATDTFGTISNNLAALIDFTKIKPSTRLELHDATNNTSTFYDLYRILNSNTAEFTESLVSTTFGCTTFSIKVNASSVTSYSVGAGITVVTPSAVAVAGSLILHY